MNYKSQRLIKLNDVPQSNVGAPLPIILSDERSTILLFYLEGSHVNSNDESPRSVSQESSDMNVCAISFLGSYDQRFGPPDENEIYFHPMASIGLEPYSAFELAPSEWADKMTFTNDLRHYIFTFHDSTFEILARSYSIEVIRETSLLTASETKISRWHSR